MNTNKQTFKYGYKKIAKKYDWIQNKKYKRTTYRANEKKLRTNESMKLLLMNEFLCMVIRNCKK